MPPSKQAKSLTYLRWLLLLPIPVLWCVANHYGLLAFLEKRSVDWRFEFRGEIEAPVKIVYVNVDTLSLNTIGGWPWSRGYFATVAGALLEAGQARAVGFDFVFSDAGVAESVDFRKLVTGNAEFGRFLNTQPPVVLAAAYAGRKFLDVNDRERERILPIIATDPRRLEQMEPPEMPSFETSPDPNKRRPYTPPVAIGLIDTIGSETRMVPAWAPSNIQRTFYHMSLELARLYWGLPPGAITVEGGRVLFRRADGGTQAAVPLLHGQFLEVNWFTPWYSSHNAHAEFSDVFIYADALRSTDPTEQEIAREYFAQDGFKDAVVLIGPADPLLQDVAPTSLDEQAVPKVSVHGNLLKTIVAGKFLSRLSDTSNNLIVFGLTLVVATLVLAGGARALFAKLMAVLALGIYVALAFRIFEVSHLVLPFTAPLGAALTTSFAGLIWRVVEEQKAKGRIKGMFGAYVSPQLVERMIESGDDPQLGGHDAEITAYFSDIQSFSSFSEKLASGPLVELMNEYLTACTDIVQAEGGTLDKYIGDAVVAMFGAPIPLLDHAYRACVATQRVHLKLSELRAKWETDGDKWPQIVWRMQSRIGLNSGVCMIGNMGSRTRFNYTMMGDNVNLAARMESGAKQWGVYTMCTDATKDACEKHGGDRVVFRGLGRIVVKGRSQAVPIYEIVGLKEDVTAEMRECIAIFEQALTRYYARDWDGALALFTRSRELEFNVPGRTPGVSTNPSLVYSEITRHYKQEAPPGVWDGVHVMTEK